MFPDPIRAFHLVVKTGSIRKTSEQLGLAPSSVSRQIAILERQMGTTLFKRSLNRLTLTYAGELVAEYAETVVLGFDSLRADLNDVRGGHRYIKVAMVESIVSSGPGSAVQLFKEKHQHVAFNFHILPAPAVIAAVRDQQCDIGITFCMAPESGVNFVAKIPEPLVALVPTDHPLGARTALSLGDLTAFAIALPDRNFGVRRIIDETCSALGVKLAMSLESNSFEAIRDYVRSGAGVAILPYRAAIREQEAGRAVCLPIEDEAFSTTTLDMIVLKQQRIPRMTRLFIDALRASIDP